jgi:SAM-dependent methyltransferase
MVGTSKGVQMFLLSESESNQWSELARHALEDGPAEPRDHAFVVAPTMRAAFFYYVGGLFAAAGLVSDARRWLEAGRDIEPIPACACLLDVLDRHGDTLVIPEVIFSDPRPWGHFAGLPTLRTARENFLRIATDSLPHFEEPLRLIDVGCGSGELGVRLMRSLIEAGKVGRVGAVALIDPSAGMLEAAGRNVAEAFPDAEIRLIQSRLEDAGALGERYDVALASSSVHHMPAELKAEHLGALSGSIDHFLLSELEANHDYPEQSSPELAFSAYQIFGRGIQWIFTEDAPDEVRRACADTFLMTEAISILTRPRGERTEYHMLRGQWRALLDLVMRGFCCVCDSTCYADEYVEQFMVHYAREAPPASRYSITS